MSAPRVERTLAAVLAADVVGYSRLMKRDEGSTFERLKAHRREMIEPLVAQHRGRIVKLTGDGALCDFHSVVDAVACAILIQQAITSDECSGEDFDPACRCRGGGRALGLPRPSHGGL